MSEDTNKAGSIIILAIIGGLVAGIICATTMVFIANTIIIEATDQVNNTLENIEINCSDEYNQFAAEIKIAEKTYYCTTEINPKTDLEEIELEN